MEFSIRPAVPDDAAEIAALHHLVWPRESADPDRIHRLLADESHRAHLASDPLGVVGYSDGFITQDINNRPRWELDLLAVHPRARRGGIGTALAKEQRKAARNASASALRGLVRLSNRGAHRTFARAGLSLDPTVYHLYTTSFAEEWQPRLPEGCHLVEVETLTYDGLWIEGAVKSETIISVLSSSSTEGTRLLGMLIDPHQIAPGDSDKMVKLIFVGAFQWYHLDLG